MIEALIAHRTAITLIFENVRAFQAFNRAANLEGYCLRVFFTDRENILAHLEKIEDVGKEVAQ